MPEPRGIAGERTALAWQRTALALMAGGAVMVRLTFGEVRWLALALLATAVPLSGWVLLDSRARYSHRAGIRPRGRPPGGRAAAALAGATLILGTTALVTVAAGRI